MRLIQRRGVYDKFKIWVRRRTFWSALECVWVCICVCLFVCLFVCVCVCVLTYTSAFSYFHNSKTVLYETILLFLCFSLALCLSLSLSLPLCRVKRGMGAFLKTDCACHLSNELISQWLALNLKYTPQAFDFRKTHKNYKWIFSIRFAFREKKSKPIPHNWH